MTLRAIKLAAARDALERHHGHRRRAAAELGVAVRTLQLWMREPELEAWRGKRCAYQSWRVPTAGANA